MNVTNVVIGAGSGMGAAVAEFLASDAASFMTGTDVLVDGGVISQLAR